MARFAGSVGQQRVPEAYMANLRVPLPPLAEQRRIGAILDAQMAAVERARAAAEQRLAAARALSSAYLRGAFESAEAARWPRVAISEIAETCSGSTPSRSEPAYYRGTIPWVKTGELRDNAIIDTEEHISEAALRETSVRVLPAGTVLVAMYGQGQTRGRTALLAVPATTNQACFAILPRPEKFSSEFLQLFFRYNYWRLRLETDARGGSQPNLNGAILRSQLVPIPGISEQARVVASVHHQLSVSTLAAASAASQYTAVQMLPTALVRSAFNGSL